MQALVEQPPVHPNDVLREIIDLAQLPVSQQPFDDDPQLQFDSQLDQEEEEEELLEPEFDQQAGGAPLNMPYGQQDFQPAQGFGEPGQGPNGGGGDAGWTDDSFTDAALDGESFGPSGFDVVEQT